ncbi:hypothetical protein BN1221_04121 [Brenneria goodwinii]|uniref:Uncharacterized protein n=1 Tax=Brenneria goodwinii TaxID=1109412 RepID=A0A0G4K137_9GAMM|nr:hypothetical protein BN1221_04121 [Brenneria goodwinii]
MCLALEATDESFAWDDFVRPRLSEAVLGVIPTANERALHQ